MAYNTKNYTEQGGDKTVIGGTLEIKEEAIIIGLPFSPLTETPVLENQAESTAENIETLVLDFNSLLSKLKVAGLMEKDE